MIKKDALLKRKLRAGRISVATGVFLFVFKVVVFLFSGSLALLASALDSVMDIFVSTVNVLAIRESEKPADREHSYGHGKIEAMACFFQSLIIFISGGYLLYESILRLFKPEIITHTPAAISVMAVSIFATLTLSAFLAREAKATQSLILKADRLHFYTDFWRDAMIIVSLIIIYFFDFYIADTLLGIGIAFYIGFSAIDLLKTAFKTLTDHELPLSFRQQIVAKIQNSHPEIKSFHDLRTRRSGKHKFVDFHLVLRENISLKKAHALAENLMTEIQKDLPHTEVMIHLDPRDDSGKRESD